VSEIVTTDINSTVKVRRRKKIGRPLVEIDADAVFKLATQACSIEEIAAQLGKKAGGGPSARAIKRRLKSDPNFREVWEDGINIGKGMLRSRMYSLAFQNQNLSVAERMSEFLAINWLGFTNGRGTSVEVKTSVEVSTSARERVTRHIDDIASKIHTRVAALAPGHGFDRGAIAGGEDGAAVADGAPPALPLPAAVGDGGA
jgi:hypothetical protein